MKIISIILMVLVVKDYILIFKRLKKFPLRLMAKMFLKAPAARNLRFQIVSDTLLAIFIIGWWIK